MRPPIIGNRSLSPVHFSQANGVHADIGLGRDKVHVPFQGQTILQTFRIAGKPSYDNDARFSHMGNSKSLIYFYNILAPLNKVFWGFHFYFFMF